LNAPKGITFAKGKLFVADIDTVVVINPHSGKILHKIPIPGARFLNDTAFNGKYVYVSDTLTNTIYQINPLNYSVKVFLQSNELEGPNGIAFTPDGKMIVVSYGNGKVFQVNKDKTLNVLTRVNGFLDGVVVLNDGTIVFSSFSGGKIYAFKNGKLRVLKSGLITPADIGYCKRKLFVPEFSANRVEIFKVK
jgi:DNA-binding beta-propeller fold protein YncE